MSYAASILLLVLGVDAFRSLFESAYFGAWHSARADLLPLSVFEFLARPEMVIIPKLFNLVAAVLIVALLIKRLIPSIAQERQRNHEQIERLEANVATHERTEELLRDSEMRNRALPLLMGCDDGFDVARRHDRLSSVQRRQHPIDHLARKADIVCRIAHGS